MYFNKRTMLVQQQKDKILNFPSCHIEFIDFACDRITNHGWSPDAVVGFTDKQSDWKDKLLVSTKTLYNYIDLGLLTIRNIDLSMKVKRNTKTKRVRKHRRFKINSTCVDRILRLEQRF